ncbi:MAG TPA: efflux transporter outer membrane subunit [Rhizomicrobium sp.]|nr:efflux transporter outer membrane subunit [Rhizomicrobium sp.]
MRTAFCVCFLALALAACVSSPPTKPQERRIEPASLGLGTVQTPQIAEAWWKAFDAPKLDDLITQALQGNPNLKVALARVRGAQSQLAASIASTYPQGTFDGNVDRERLSSDYIIPPPYAGTTRWVGTLQANLSYSLDLFDKEQDQIDRARASARGAALDEQAARLLLAGNVTQAYIALSRAWALCDVADEAVKQREGVLKLSVERVRAGLDTVASQHQAEALLALAREEQVRTKALRDIAVHQIAALVGRGADAYDIPRPVFNEAALALPDALPADLLARRADVAAAEARINAAVSGREIARKAFYPDINLVALAGTAAIGLGPLFSSEAGQYGGGAAIHLPIFDAGKLRAQYAGATADLDGAVADYNSTVVNAVRQASDGITNLRAIDGEAAQQHAALRAVEQSFDLTVKRYKNGLNPLQTTLDAESVLIQARRDNASLSADAASARVSLLMALGGGFDGSKLISKDDDHG